MQIKRINRINARNRYSYCVSLYVRDIIDGSMFVFHH